MHDFLSGTRHAEDPPYRGLVMNTRRRVLRPLAALVLVSHTLTLGVGLAQSPVTYGQVTNAATQVNPALGKELKILEKQIDGLLKNVNAVDKAIQPVAQSATKAVNTVSSYPQQVDAFKTKYGIPQDPTLSQEVKGIGRYVRDKLGISPAQAAKTSAAIQKSPAFEQFKQPFQPASIMLAVGATAGVKIFSQLQGGDGVDLTETFSFLGQGSFWGGLVGSGLGYGLMASVATAMFPAGAGLLPVLAPMFAGMTGSIFGWEVGSGILQGRSLGETLQTLNPASMLGQAAGSTVGLLVGANLGAAIGGTLGAVAGPVGAIAGAMLMSKVGAGIGDAVKSMLKGDASDMNSILKDAGVVIDKIQKAEKGLAGVVPPSLPAASLAAEGLPSKLKGEYDKTYDELKAALESGDRALAHQKIQYLNRLSSRYSQSVGESLQRLGR